MSRPNVVSCSDPLGRKQDSLSALKPQQSAQKSAWTPSQSPAALWKGSQTPGTQRRWSNDEHTDFPGGILRSKLHGIRPPARNVASSALPERALSAAAVQASIAQEDEPEAVPKQVIGCQYIEFLFLDKWSSIMPISDITLQDSTVILCFTRSLQSNSKASDALTISNNKRYGVGV